MFNNFTTKFNKLNQDSFIIILLLIFAGILLYLGVMTTPDTGGYLSISSVRSALYPLLLKIYIAIWPNNFIWLILMQILLGIWAAYKLIKSFCVYFDLPYLKFIWFRVVGLIILLSPYWGTLKNGNHIMSEAICYPLFLLAIDSLLSTIKTNNHKKIFNFLFLTSLLILTRRQFLFIYPVITLFIIYLFVINKWNKKQLFSISLAFLLSIAATDLLERSFHYIYHGRFAHVPFTGMQLIVAPVYLSKKQDVNLFASKIEQQIFADIYNDLEKEIFYNLTPWKRKNSFLFYHYYEHYNTISHKIVPKAFSNHISSDAWTIDAMQINMAKTLIKHNFKEYVFLYALNIILNFGGFFFALFLFFWLIYATFWHAKYKDNLSLITILILSFGFTNYALVALVETIFNRYTQYTDTILMLLLLTQSIALWDKHVRHSG